MPKLKINPSRQPHPQPQPQPTQIVSQQWSGPLPPPAALASFNEIIPDGANRIMTMIEQEQAHRISHDTQVLTSFAADIKRGHLIGGLVCLVAVGGAIYTAAIGVHFSVPIALVGVPVLGMIKAFMPSKNRSTND
jgi:uncharacterized membrane protein